MLSQIPKIDYRLLCNGGRTSREEKVAFDNLKIALRNYGFLIIQNQPIA